MNDDNIQDTNELEGEEIVVSAEPSGESGDSKSSKSPPPVKKDGLLKRFWHRFNVYLLIFVLLLVIGGAYAVITYLNGKKIPKEPEVVTQELTQETLEQLAKSDANIGSNKTVLNVQSNAVFSGQVVIGGDLNVAGAIKIGKPLSIPNLTVSDDTNLNKVQISSLQVAQNTTMQGNLVVQKDFNVAGSVDINGSARAKQLTVTDLTISSGGTFMLEGHINVGGATPSRTYGSALGSGGTVTNSGTDTAGIVNINTGGGAGNGCLATINFSSPFRVEPFVGLTPASPDTATINYYIKRSKSNFQICTIGNVSGKALSFTYIIFD